MSIALKVAALGFAVGLAGDACHVASGTTVYEWTALPVIWESRAWFPVLVASAVTAGAWLGWHAGLPAARARTPLDVVAGAAVVLALYALTAALRHQPTTVGVILTGSIAVAIWAWWDPSPGALVAALVAAVVGPLAEIVIVALDAAHYAPGVDGLGGVAPWLPCLYFGAGAVISGIWGALAGAAPSRRAARLS